MEYDDKKNNAPNILSRFDYIDEEINLLNACRV